MKGAKPSRFFQGVPLGEEERRDVVDGRDGRRPAGERDDAEAAEEGVRARAARREAGRGLEPERPGQGRRGRHGHPSLQGGRHEHGPGREEDEGIVRPLGQPGGQEALEVASDAGRPLLERPRVDGNAHPVHVIFRGSSAPRRLPAWT